MTKQDTGQPDLDHQFLLDRLYEVALNPDTLESFIDLWEETDPVTRNRHSFDLAFEKHLERAERFLDNTDRSTSDLSELLAPYQAFAAFLIDASCHIVASNNGAATAFGIINGQSVDVLDLPDGTLRDIQNIVSEFIETSEVTERTLISTGPDQTENLLLRLQRVSGTTDAPVVLVVSTLLHWGDATSSLLKDKFGLTDAEKDVTRALTEGRDARAIADLRNTSVETVRAQIKAIIRKLKLRSQADVVRFVTALTAIQGASYKIATTRSTTPVLTQDALSTEFWKPFRSITLPDGRKLTFHDMGPPSGHPILFSHMGSCMVRWSRQMLRMAFLNNLRVICPIRAGFGESDPLPRGVDLFQQTSEDTVFLLQSLDISRLPYVVQGTDFPFATALIARFPGLVSELIAVGGKPCFPGGAQVEARGRWQKFFVSAARNNPKLLQFASSSVMAMSRRVSHETMLKRLCKDSPSDLACIQVPDLKEALVANIAMMATKSPNIARAFATEFTAFQEDWSTDVIKSAGTPIKVFVAKEDPTIDLTQLPLLQRAYPWIKFESIEQAGLALMFQHYRHLIPMFATAASATRQRA